jgi:uncharacterized protein YkwD
MNNRQNVIAVILLLFLVTITPVIAADYYGSLTDEASSADGTFTIKSTENSTIWFFERGNNASTWTYNIRGEIWSVAISPDSKNIAVGSDGGFIWLFDQKGTVIWNKTFGNAGIKSIVFSEDGQYLDASNFMNLAFYITLEGNRATRPVSTTISVVPSSTTALTPAQTPLNLDLSWVGSFVSNNQTLLIGIIVGLGIAGIAWYAVSCRGYQRGKIASVWDLITLRNFTIFSLLLMLVGISPSFYPLNNYSGMLQTAFEIGIFCFLLAYFIYGLKCWDSDNTLWAVLMVSIPLLAYFLATSKIPDSTTNILFYLAIQFCFYAVVSAIVLYVCNIVKMGVEGIFTGRTLKSYRSSSPEFSYAVTGVVIVSFLMVNAGSVGIFTGNTDMVTQSLQKMISPGYPSANAGTGTSSANSENLPLPTLPPDIVKNIESSVGNVKPAIEISELEMEIHTKINEQRRSNGLSPLSYDASLASIARKHSADMARNNYFSHNNLQGLDPSDRATRDGYSCYKNYGSFYTTGLAENIMQNNLYDSVTYYNGIPRYDWNTQEEIAQSTVSGWMTSAGHRRNILTTTYDKEGIGVAIASDDKVYVTEDFC